MSKNNRTIRITVIIISIIIVIVAILGVKEYMEFMSDFKLYIHSLQKLNESYVLKNDINVYSEEYKNIARIEEKYERGIFNSVFEGIQKENAKIMKEIEQKRQEENRTQNVKVEKNEIRSEREEYIRKEIERSESERRERERIEQERIEKERSERERMEIERIERERAERERVEKKRRENTEEIEIKVFEQGPFKREVKIVEEKIIEGVIANHDYVDLGLSVKWATCNVGANYPHEYGNYYSWSEVETKDNYTKYNSIQSDLLYNDVASQEWGNEWRTPTLAECMELVNKCRWEWTTKNGVNGYKITGLIGTSIFLPATGDYDGEIRYHEGNDGYYWSSTPHETLSNMAYGISFKRTKYRVTSYSKYLGKTIRPVTK